MEISSLANCVKNVNIGAKYQWKIIETLILLFMASKFRELYIGSTGIQVTFIVSKRMYLFVC